MSLNLARQPFVNSRPVRRLALLLWVLGAALLIVNALSYWRHFTGQEERSERRAALEQQAGQDRERLRELEEEMSAADLESQNRQVAYLNVRIAERTFPWSRLFDRLSEVLPANVRLTQLRPQIARGPRRAGSAEEAVRLEIRGEARNDEAMLGMVQAFFEHEAFRRPNLSSESRRERVTDFVLAVTYLPSRGPSPESAAASESAAGEVTE